MLAIVACSETRTRVVEEATSGDPTGGGTGQLPDASGTGAADTPAPPGDAGSDAGSPQDVPTIVDGDPGDASGPEDTAEGDGGPVDGDGGGADTTDGDAGDAFSPPPPERACAVTFEYGHSGAAPAFVGLASEVNGWKPQLQPFSDPDGDGTWTTTLDTSDIPPGTYGYKIVTQQAGDQPFPSDSAVWSLDPATPMRKFVDGIENSKVRIPDCRVPLLALESLDVGADTVHAVVAVQGGAGGEGVAPASAQVRHGFQDLGAAPYDPGSQRFTVALSGLAAGKHTLRFDIANAHGAAESLMLPIWVEPAPFDWRDAVLYFAMTDRFFDGDPATGTPAACLPADNKANWQGGDWAGIRQKLEAGHFTELGVTALWLTAVVDNPDGCFAGALGYQYTAYHGYFPSAMTTPENHLGQLADLQALVAAAHARGIRVLVDLVANHLHEDHPVAKGPDAGLWFNDFFQCGFDEAPLTCWFESYLPDLDYREDVVVEAMTDMALWWVREADLDGFRVDAVKHMHDNFLLTLRQELRRQVETVPAGPRFYMVGETFVGDWEDGTGPNEQLVKKYVTPALLDGQFEFPLYWRLLRFLARDQSGATHLADYFEASAGYWGAGAIMSTFLGNHDLPRFASHATPGVIPDEWGNGAKTIGWDNPPPQPADAGPYERLRLAFTVLFTNPGIPLIYYGDEIGLAGAGDPDNRRVMAFDGLSAHQLATRSHVGKLAAIRAAHPALRRGAYQTLQTTEDLLVYRRALGDDVVVVAVNRGAASVAAQVSAPAAGPFTDALGGAAVSPQGGTLSFTVPARGAVILVR